MFSKIKIIFIVLVLTSMFFGLAKAADQLPEPMVGATKVVLDTNHSIKLDGSNTAYTLESTGQQTSFTVMAWIKPTDSTKTYQDVVSQGRMVSDSSVSGPGWGFGIYNRNNGTSLVRVYLGDSTADVSNQTFFSTDSFPTTDLYNGLWHHIAFSWDSQTGIVDLYFDNILKTVAGTVKQAIIPPTSNGLVKHLYIGSSTYSANNNYGDRNGFVGNIDEVRIYSTSTPHSVSERNDIKLSGTTPYAESPAIEGVMSNSLFTLQHCWNFNDSAATWNSKITTDIGPSEQDSQLAPLYQNFHSPIQESDVIPNLQTYYGGITGNETILNYENSGLSTTDSGLLGFDRSRLSTCIVAPLPAPFCFALNFGSQIGIMNSRTSINGQAVSEVATLLYPSAPLIVGDAYLGSGSAGDFAYWGRNLTQNIGAGSNNTYWGLSGYTMNPNSQSLLGGGPYTQYTDKIKNLAAQAATISDLSSVSWNLQSTDSTLIGANDSNKYPEGKVWMYNGGGTPTLGSKVISGKGTIIFPNGFILSSGASITKSNAATDSLGLISQAGPVTFSGNNNVYAAVFSEGSFVAANNSSFYGSFVSPTFTLTGGGTNDQFYYDYKLSDDWPPGFHDLNMPQAKESN